MKSYICYGIIQMQNRETIIRNTGRKGEGVVCVHLFFHNLISDIRFSGPYTLYFIGLPWPTDILDAFPIYFSFKLKFVILCYFQYEMYLHLWRVWFEPYLCDFLRVHHSESILFCYFLITDLPRIIFSGRMITFICVMTSSLLFSLDS